MDITNISAADLQGPKRSSESGKKDAKNVSGKDSPKGVSDSLSISSASIEMEKRLKALSERLRQLDPVRREKVEEVKGRLEKGDLENDDAIKEAVENYIEIGVRVYLFDDASQFQLQERGQHSLEITTLLCPYLSSCRDLLEKGFSLRDLTCARIGCFRSAVEILTGIRCDYEVTSVRLEEGCTGIIEAV